MSSKSLKRSSLNKKKENQKILPEGMDKNISILKNDKILWIIVSIVFLFVLYVRVRLLSTPLERDEGEYAYMGQLLLKGIIPFKEAYNMKLPGTSIMYAVIMFLFGENAIGIHIGLLLLNAGSAFLLFLLYRKWSYTDSKPLIASSIFAFLAINPAIAGFASHATHFVVFFSLAGLVLLYRAFCRSTSLPYLLSGLMFGLAILMKQPAIFFVLFGIILIIKQYFLKLYSIKDLLRYSIIFITGIFAPVIILIIILQIGGTFDRFWFWTVQYGMQYASLIPLNQGLEVFKVSFSHIFSESYLFWLFAAIGTLLLFLNNQRKNVRLEIILFLVASFIAIVPGFYFREHYFIMLLPSISILVVEGIYFSKTKIRIKNSDFALLTIFTIIILWTVISNNAYYLYDSPEVTIQKAYGISGFIESIPISEFITAHTDQDDRIQVLGSEPQIYFYSKRMAASGQIYMYGLMEPQKYSSEMQQELINDIARVNPKYIVFSKIATSWLVRSNSNVHILIWSYEFVNKNYNIVGIVDIGEETVYKWMNDANAYQPRSDNLIYIFERKHSSL
jgi:hypothetical protein